MFTLSCFPKGIDPQGKQKIYLCGHPADLELYTDVILDDLLRAVSDRSFTVCRKEREDPEDRDLLPYLKEEVSLAVVPVTFRFLTEESPGRDREVPFALKNHIPVLPILLDSPDPELLKAFGAVFGDLQYLNRHETDLTTLPYGEKLRQFLSDLLLNDDTAAKIRAAFDAYIFLSYRKKDRKYAQHLMRLIHKNDFCRDIAVWYDEFLTPGEDFNDNIQKALDKSKLFALAVTPNLINETNYVMTVEYPMAKKVKKPILAVELEKTDGNRLQDLYDEIPAPVKAEDSITLSKELLHGLQGIALRENDHDPVHNFFIGLAYLSGIDVEIDHERALQLITSCAEAGLPEGMEKLVSMYEKGEGTARSYEASLFWHRRLAARRREIFAESGLEEDAKAYVNVLKSLGNALHRLYRQQEALKVCEELYRVTEELCKRFSSPWTKREHSVSCNKTGLILLSEKDDKKAKEYFLRSMEIANKRQAQESDPTVLRDRAVTHSYLGRICFRNKDYQGAAWHQDQALNIFRDLAKNDDSERSYRDRILLCIDLANTELTRKNRDAASALCEEALSLCAELRSLRHDRAASRLTGSVNLLLGRVRITQNRKEKAAECFIQAKEALEECAELEQTPGEYRSVVLANNRLGAFFLDKGDLEKSKEYYEASLAITLRTEELYGTIQNKEDLAISYGNLSLVARKTGNYEEEKRYLQKALPYCEILTELSENPNMKWGLGLFCEQIADACTNLSQIPQAAEYYCRAIDLHDRRAKEEGTEHTYVQAAICHNKLAALLMGKEQTDALHRCLQRWKHLTETYPENELYQRNYALHKKLFPQEP